MNKIIPSPREYGLPHEKWRPYQLETIHKLLENDKFEKLIIDDGFYIYVKK